MYLPEKNKCGFPKHPENKEPPGSCMVSSTGAMVPSSWLEGWYRKTLKRKQSVSSESSYCRCTGWLYIPPTAPEDMHRMEFQESSLPSYLGQVTLHLSCIEQKY